MRFPFACVLSVPALLAGCGDQRPDQWDAYVYPNRYDLTDHYVLRGFKTFELCQEAAIGELRRQELADQGDYECGYRCGPDADFGGMNLCEETRK